MELNKAATLISMCRAVGEQFRERHFIEPVKGGCIVRSCTFFLFYANNTSRQRSDADTPQGQPQAVPVEQSIYSFPFPPA